jgi:hypothetical protein
MVLKSHTPALRQPASTDEIESKIEIGLEEARNAPLSPNITAALQYLVPKDYRPVVQLEQVGPKKRNAETEWNWHPETARIVIYYERSNPNANAPTGEPAGSSKTQRLGSQSDATDQRVAAGLEEITPLQIQQCCEALAEAEKAGKLFIAFKWFRDEELLKYKFDWIASPEQRQRVLARAIETDAIQTQRIPNPKSPQHPTTTVKLNRKEAPRTLSKRFNPIVVRGEPVSVTIMRDRGSL